VDTDQAPIAQRRPRPRIRPAAAPSVLPFALLVSKGPPQLDFSGIVDALWLPEGISPPLQQRGGTGRSGMQRTRRLRHALAQQRRTIGGLPELLIWVRRAPPDEAVLTLLAVPCEPVLTDFPDHVIQAAHGVGDTLPCEQDRNQTNVPAFDVWR
jgi:hypothetical protein